MKLIDPALGSLIDTFHLVGGLVHRIASALTDFGSSFEKMPADHVLAQQAIAPARAPITLPSIERGRCPALSVTVRGFAVGHCSRLSGLGRPSRYAPRHCRSPLRFRHS